MRRLVILLVVVFVASLVSMPAISATKGVTTPKAHKMTTKHKLHKKTAMKPKAKYRCYRVVRHKAKAMPARKGAGPATRPVVNCPAPVVNVPQQPAPVVNVPEQPAPVVNVAAPPPSTAITVDTSSIYIVRDNQLIILNKSDLCLKSKVSLDQVGSTPMATTGSQ